jgi:hypothetical protein
MFGRSGENNLKALSRAFLALTDTDWFDTDSHCFYIATENTESTEKR